ncbi:MAG: universal stress protein [Anaerolineae bacterium]|nr:universal stress protein [Anaerolineae bacterium]
MAEKGKPDAAQALLDAVKAEEWYKRQAELISHKWEDRLDAFELPCPLCKGVLVFQGARRDQFYEFAEGEPGMVTPVHVLPISFVCNLCGYTAEFDAELFNPAYLAKLQGAAPDRVAELSVREFRVLVPLAGAEKSETLLDLASALAGVRHGEVVALNIAANPAASEQLNEKLQHYKPGIGDPAPLRMLIQQTADIGEAIVQVARRQRCQLVMVGWRGWTRNPEAMMGTVLDPVLNEASCDVAVVHDRGLLKVHRILLPTAGGPNVKIAIHLALDLARAFDAELHLLYVALPKAPDPEAQGQTHIAETLGDIPVGEGIILERRIVVDADPVRAIVQESASYDLLILGASHRDWRGRIRRNSIVAKIVRNAGPTALVVSERQSRLGSWFARLFSAVV